jgi:hypothetical protein
MCQARRIDCSDLEAAIPYAHVGPAEGVDEVMTQRGMKAVDDAHGSSSISSTLDAPAAARSATVI